MLVERKQHLFVFRASERRNVGVDITLSLSEAREKGALISILIG